PEGLKRRFVVHAYELEAIHRWRVDDRPFATLIVRGLGSRRASHFRLGFSRDMDPFALVVADEVQTYGDDLDKDAGRDARCGVPLQGDSEIDAALAGCGQALEIARARVDAGLRDAVLASTERHELQHQIDGPHLPLAPAVAELLAGYAKASQDRA